MKKSVISFIAVMLVIVRRDCGNGIVCAGRLEHAVPGCGGIGYRR